LWFEFQSFWKVGLAVPNKKIANDMYFDGLAMTEDSDKNGNDWVLESTHSTHMEQILQITNMIKLKISLLKIETQLYFYSIQNPNPTLPTATSNR
jgi:hypothetical protein